MERAIPGAPDHQHSSEGAGISTAAILEWFVVPDIYKKCRGGTLLFGKKKHSYISLSKQLGSGTKLLRTDGKTNGAGSISHSGLGLL